MRSTSALLVAIALGLAGSAEAKKAAEGRPVFRAGDPEGFFIWHDASGWHLRTTTAKKQHNFRGVVRAPGISGVKATRAALSAKLTAAPSSIRFEYDLFEGVDGFDWNQTDPCVTLELKLDLTVQNDRIHVGQKGESPSAQPFDACQ